jgi:hypothetical protein
VATITRRPVSRVLLLKHGRFLRAAHAGFADLRGFRNEGSVDGETIVG